MTFTAKTQGAQPLTTYTMKINALAGWVIAASAVAGLSIHKAMTTDTTTAASNNGPNESQSVVACKIKLERSLRDPGSVRYDRNLTAYTYENNLHKVALVYNAKNGFGGYVGQDIYTCTFK